MCRAALLVIVLTAPAFGQHNIKWSNQNECGKIMRDAVPSSLVSSELQWPWRVSIFFIKNLEPSNHFCGGTLVTRRHVITTAVGTTYDDTMDALEHQRFTLFVGKFSFTDKHDGTPIMFVKKITVHPDYDQSNRANNLAIIELQDPISYSGWAQPACLWPKDLDDSSNIINKTGFVLGWGFDFILKRSRELKLMNMPVVSQEDCVISDRQFYESRATNLTYCAGDRNGISTRNINNGEGMLFNNGGTWYLRGVVSGCNLIDDTNSCDPTHYIIFTDLAKYLPWIYAIINDN